MNVIQKFQTEAGLKPDGVIGRLTMGAFVMRFGLTPIQAAMLLGQADHESAGFNLLLENLNYSAEGLLKTFAKYYKRDTALALKHERKPSVIANFVYGGRMGNDGQNDGWTYRGRGALQLTGRDNYTAFAIWAKDPKIIVEPDLVATTYALSSAVWFFQKNRLFSLCVDTSDATILKISKAVNIGNPESRLTPNGLEDRIEKTRKYTKLI
jgi:putative chitinase